MRTLGIDLAAQAKGTFLCELEWRRDGKVFLVELRQNEEHAADDDLRSHIARPGITCVGVDVPFGWPVAFVELMNGQGDIRAWQDRASERLRLRATDRACREAPLAMTPLSVTMDRIAAPAMRWRLLSRLLPTESPPRVEVYPAAALKTWGLPHEGYKRPEQGAARRTTLDAVTRALELTLSGPQRALLVDRADALDALVAALVARASTLDRTRRPPAELALLAAEEGWIHVPTCAIMDLRFARAALA